MLVGHSTSDHVPATVSVVSGSAIWQNQMPWQLAYPPLLTDRCRHQPFVSLIHRWRHRLCNKSQWVVYDTQVCSLNIILVLFLSLLLFMFNIHNRYLNSLFIFISHIRYSNLLFIIHIDYLYSFFVFVIHILYSYPFFVFNTYHYLLSIFVVHIHYSHIVITTLNSVVSYALFFNASSVLYEICLYLYSLFLFITHVIYKCLIGFCVQKQQNLSNDAKHSMWRTEKKHTSTVWQIQFASR